MTRNPTEGATLVVDVTREEAAHRKFSHALERFRRAELELAHAMNDLCAGVNAMRELGVVADVEMKPAMQAVWVEHRAAARRAA